MKSLSQRLLRDVLIGIGIAIALLTAGCATAPSKISVPADTVSFAPNAWVISFSPNMPAHPTTSGNGWYFDFPSQDGVHYVLVPYHANKPHSTLTVTYRVSTISGAPRFVGADTGCENHDPNFKPMLERNGDNMNSEFFRWWSNPEEGVLIPDGKTHTFTVALNYFHWSDVYGKFNASELSASFKDLMAVGLTFGSGCSAGHGVWVVGGKARFELLGYKIE